MRGPGGEPAANQRPGTAHSLHTRDPNNRIKYQHWHPRPRPSLHPPPRLVPIYQSSEDTTLYQSLDDG